MRLKNLSKRAAATGGRSLRWLWRGLLGVAVTCVILIFVIGISIAVAPVSLLTRNLNLAPAVVAVYGSVREGRADLSGGYQLTWDSRIALLPLPHVAMDLLLTGSDTRLTGQAQAGARGAIVRDVAGRAGPKLAQLVPGAWDCEMTATVEGVALGWYWRSVPAAGRVETPEGACEKDGRSITVARLALDLRSDGRDGVIDLSAVPDATSMAQVRISRDRVLDIMIAPAAADVFPQLPRGGPIQLTLPF